MFLMPLDQILPNPSYRNKIYGCSPNTKKEKEEMLRETTWLPWGEGPHKELVKGQGRQACLEVLPWETFPAYMPFMTAWE